MKPHPECEVCKARAAAEQAHVERMARMAGETDERIRGRNALLGMRRNGGPVRVPTGESALFEEGFRDMARLYGVDLAAAGRE